MVRRWGGRKIIRRVGGDYGEEEEIMVRRWRGRQIIR